MILSTLVNRAVITSLLYVRVVRSRPITILILNNCRYNCDVSDVSSWPSDIVQGNFVAAENYNSYRYILVKIEQN